MSRKCERYKKWVEERIEEPIKEREEKTRKRCKKKKCKKRCLCCNKWFCWIEPFFEWIVRWVVTIIGKWLVYVTCRAISILWTVILTAVNILGWPVKWLYCMLFGWGKLGLLPMHTLQLEVLIVDPDEVKRNPVTVEEIEQRMAHADRILRDQARIHVKRSGPIGRMVSSSLYRLDASTFGALTSEYLKGLGTLLGRNDARHLTVYVVGSIQEGDGLHLPGYGSVFIRPGSPDTSLCHEIGHALLSLGNAYHNSRKDHLMYTPAWERESASGWPQGIPKLSRNERCTMRRSRWLDWSWVPFLP